MSFVYFANNGSDSMHLLLQQEAHRISLQKYIISRMEESHKRGGYIVMEQIFDAKELLTVEDLRRILPFGRDRCYALMHNPAFPSIQIGNRYFVQSKALLKWMDNYQGKKFLL